MPDNLIAHASTTVNAPPKEVWDALTTPETIKRYMFGTTVISDWKVGSPIVFTGEWEGKKYEDKGVITQLDPEQVIQYTHFSPLTGLPDKPENYHTVTIELTPDGDRTHVALSQDNNATERAREHSTKNWEMMLTNLKKVLES